jgi:succinate-acetate transporter protein
VDWLRNPLDIDKLWSFAGRGDFWLQVVIYGLHYLMLLGAPIGLWIMRKRWQFTSVLLGFIVYTLLLHFVTLAIPRYIFPTYSALWILASPALVALGQDIAQRLSHRWQEQSPQR